MLFPAALQAQTDAADVPKLLEDLNRKDDPAALINVGTWTTGDKSFLFFKAMI